MLETLDHGDVREVRLARPPANALSPALVESLTGMLAEAGESAAAVVVSGQPGMFSAGLDIPELMQLDRGEMSRFWQSFLRMLKTIAFMPVPTAFALTGHAPAGGIVMALFGDYRIMPKGGFKTGLNEVQVGLVVSSSIHQALVRAVGPRTIEWCEQHLALPRQAMLTTREMARRDLHGFFDGNIEQGVEGFVEIWFSEATHNTLRALMERLKKR
jgi:enoyl-CoA hydratase/carnithine racemase